MSFGNYMTMAADASYSSTANAVNTAVQAYSNKKQREFTREMSDLAWQRDQEMWNMQNKYNSPASQMQRFRDAGLNPRLIYGRGNEGNATQYPKYQAPYGKFEVNKIDTRLGLTDMYNDIRMKDAQIELVNQQKKIGIQTERINKGKADITEGMAGIIKDTVANKLKEYDYKNKGYEYDLQAKQQRVEKIKAEIIRDLESANLSRAQIDKVNKWFEYMDKGVNLDRDPYWIRWLMDVYNRMFPSGGTNVSEVPGIPLSTRNDFN